MLGERSEEGAQATAEAPPSKRGELLAELERLAAETSVSRARLAEILGRIKRLKDELAEAGPPTSEPESVAFKVHSAG